MARANASLLAILLAAAAGRGSAQALDHQTEALAVRVEHGDNAARRQLRQFAWNLVEQANQLALTLPENRMLARVALAMARPISPPDASMGTEEHLWRAPAVRALRHILEADSGDIWSAEQLEAIAPYPHLWLTPDNELTQLRALNARHAALPTDLALTRTRLEIERGSLDSAAAVLRNLPGADVSTAARMHVAAEIAFASNADSAGRAAYFLGARGIRDSADAAWYTRDLQWIARPKELDEWNRLIPDARAAWLEVFWMRRDFDDAQLPGTRVAEQFRRWRIALRDYRWVYDGGTAEGIGVPPGAALVYNTASKRLFRHSLKDEPMYLTLVNRLLPLSRILDDRGGLVLRHGMPTVRANLPMNEAAAEETWRWNTPDGPLVVGFTRTDPTSARFGMIARNFPPGNLMVDCELDRRLCATLPHDLIPGYIQMRETAEHTDGNRETYVTDLGAIVQAYGIPQGGALIVVAIPAARLVADNRTLDQVRSFAARVRVIVGDSAQGKIVASLDTVRRWQVNEPVGAGSMLTAYVTLPVPTGSWSVAVAAGDTLHHAGSGERFAAVPVVPFDGKTLRLGDPILGRESSGLDWIRHGEPVPLNPTGAWHVDEPAILTYEIDGLVPGRSYQTKFELWQTSGSPKAPKNVTAFSDAAVTITQTVQRELSLRELPPGDYRLVVRVRDIVTNVEVTRERRLAVRK